MRILYVTAIKPSSPNGLARFDRKLSAYLEAGVSIGVVCGIDEAEQAQPPAGVELFPVRFNTAKLPFSIVDALDEVPLPSIHVNEDIDAIRHQLNDAFADVIADAVRSFEPDVIVCSHLTLITSIVLECAGNTPVAGICHSVCMHEFLEHADARELMAANMERLSLVFACYEAQRELMIDEFCISPDKVKVLHGSCDTSVFTMDGHRVYRNASAPSINIVTAGKFTYKNGIQSLLQAVSLLPCRPNSVTLRMCGKTENSFQRAALDVLMRENPQNIEVAGWLDSEGLAEEYRRAQIFVLPAFYDELPLAVLEALACECKVVATRLPGLEPWIEENVPGASVFFVDPPRMQELDAPLKCDLADFERRMSEAIKEAVLAPLRPVDLSRLSWARRAEHVISACKELLGEKA